MYLLFETSDGWPAARSSPEDTVKFRNTFANAEPERLKSKVERVGWAWRRESDRDERTYQRSATRLKRQVWLGAWSSLVTNLEVLQSYISHG